MCVFFVAVRRVWPEEDEDAVLALCSLTHHVTGLKMRAHFVETPSQAEQAQAQAQAEMRAQQEGGGAGGVPPYTLPFGRRRKWQHWFRRWRLRCVGVHVDG